MTGTANMNLHHLWYNLDGWTKADEWIRVNINTINQGVVHINVSKPTDLKMFKEKQCYMSWGWY